MTNDITTELIPTNNAARSGFNAVLAVVLVLGAIVWAADLPRQVGLLLYTEQFLSAILAVAVPLVFLSIRRRKTAPVRPAPWYDILAAAIGFSTGAYLAVRYPVLAELVAMSPTDGLVAGTVLMVLIIEGLRRTIGPILTVVVILFLIMALLGHHLPGALTGRRMQWDTLFYYLSWDPTGILGVPMRVVSTIVITFVFFGQVLIKSGGSSFFTEISMVLVGRYRGGQAKIAVTASGLFGSISGSVVSNVVTTGVITIPLMRNAGYRAVHAGAIEAVASTGGQLMPPIMGAAAFLMAEFLEIPYAEVVLAALIPALLYYAALFILADLEAARTGITRIPEDKIPKLWPVVKSGWFFPVPFAVLIGTLFWLNYTPEEAALTAALVIIAMGMVIGYKGRRMTPRDVVEAVRDTGFAVLDIIMIGAAAGIVIGTLNVTGIGFGMSLALVELGSDNIVLLLVISAGICILLGMGMPTVGVYLMLATLVAPSLIEVGVDPIAAHLFILYFGMMSMITPPVAIAAFAAASLTGADAMQTGFSAMRFGWFAYIVPFMFIFTPEITMRGDTISVILMTGAALAGIWFVSLGIMGYMVRRLGIVRRVIFLAAGIALLLPEKMLSIDWPIPLAVIGAVAGLAMTARELLSNRSTRAGATP